LPGGGGEEHRVAAHADDMLFLLEQPRISLPNLLEAFRLYGVVSNLKLNLAKSELMPLTRDPALHRHIQAHFPFRICLTKLRYQGIWLPCDLAQAYSMNYVPLLTALQQDMKRWAPQYISWFGRINAIKMNVMPRILYLFQTIPVIVPRNFFQTLSSAFKQFVWNQRPARIRQSILERPRSEGGMGLPSVLTYYRATHLSRLVDWHAAPSGKRWVDMEKEQELRTGNPLVDATLKVWCGIRYSQQLTSSPNPLMPVTHNPRLAGGLSPGDLRNFGATDWTYLHQWCNGPSLKSLAALLQDRGPSVLDNFRYYQLTTYVTSLAGKAHLHRPLSHFEQLCVARQHLIHGISQLYSMLQSGGDQSPLGFTIRWEMEAGVELSTSDWQKIFQLTHRGTICSKFQECNYKILSSWYRTPDILRHVHESISGECWRCGNADGTGIHIWWSCPRIEPFWRTIHKGIKDVTGTDIPFQPLPMLLNHTSMPITAYKRGLMIHLLTAAKSLIPMLWRSQVAPSLRQWIDREWFHALV
ncbi:Hypothetical predicted protein, partial [Pelobates cultripes]